MQHNPAPEAIPLRHGVLFALFFVSGACGLLYQVVWLRLAFAAFGVITPVLSVVVAVFMLGLALGSWGAGTWVSDWSRRTGLSAIYFYAVAELVVGISAFVVPGAFRQGQTLATAPGRSRLLRLSAVLSNHSGRFDPARLYRHGYDVSTDAGICKGDRSRR